LSSSQSTIALSAAEAEDMYKWFMVDYEEEMKRKYVSREKQEEYLGICVEWYSGA